MAYVFKPEKTRQDIANDELESTQIFCPLPVLNSIDGNRDDLKRQAHDFVNNMNSYMFQVAKRKETLKGEIMEK